MPLVKRAGRRKPGQAPPLPVFSLIAISNRKETTRIRERHPRRLNSHTCWLFTTHYSLPTTHFLAQRHLPHLSDAALIRHF
jgi:hypothetical protein